MSSDHDNSVMSFLIGAAVGGITALLLAPRSGEDTRRQLRESAESLQDRSSELVRTATDEAKTRTHDATEKLKDRADDVQETVKETVHEAGSTARGQVDAVKEAAAEAKRAYRKELGRQG